MARALSVLITTSNDLVHDQRMQRIATALAEFGHQVTLVGRCYADSPGLPEGVPYSQRRLKCRSRRGKMFYLEYNLRLLFFLLRAPQQVFYSVDLDTLLPQRIISALKGRRRVYDAHEYFTEVPEVVGRPLTQWIWRVVARLCIPGQHMCITVGQALADVLSQRYGVAFEVVRNVPSAEEYLHAQTLPPPVRVLPNTILYQGALNEGRCLEQAIDMMEKLPGYNLMIVGEGPLSEALRARAAAGSARDRIQFTGWQSPEALKRLTPHAKFGYNVLEPRGESYRLSLSNKFFDYIHAGVPSINACFPEYKSLLEKYHTGICTADASLDAIYSSIHCIANNTGEYERMRANCFAAAPALSWESEKRKLISRFEKL